MRRFVFKLEKVLELREYHEREWELKLADVTGRIIGVEQELASWARQRSTTIGASVRRGAVDMADLRSRADYVTMIDDRVRQLQTRLVSLEAERAKVRERYLEVSRKRKALSRLKERRAEEYYDEAQKEEHRLLDEIGGVMTARRRTGQEE